MPYRLTLAAAPRSLTSLLAALATIALATAPAAAQCWSEGATAPVGLVARAGHAAAYDFSTSRLVVFGGTDRSATPLNDTWEYGPAGWTPGPSAPPGLYPRSGHKMVYDGNRGRIVLFGGVDEFGNYSDETWEYGGGTWFRGDGAPSDMYPRSKHAMTYDANRDVIVLFGGHDAEYLFNDTWELGPGGWYQGPIGPPELTARAHHTLTYHDASGLVVLFGGDEGFADWLNDTWLYDGSAWFPNPNPTPSGLNPRGNHSATYDWDRGVIVMFGGWDIATAFNDTWEFDGSDWYPGANPAAGLNGRHASSLDYDYAAGKAVLFGGYNTSEHFDETWEMRDSCCPTISIAPSGLPLGYVGTAYSAQIQASGGVAPYGYAMPTGSLPAGVTLSSSGLLSGTPTATGTFAFTVDVVDSRGCRGSIDYSLTVYSCALAITPQTLLSGTVGIGYTQALTGSGGQAPYAFSVVAGGLPVGLALSTSGVISGTPTIAGIYGFDIFITDAVACGAVQSFTLLIDGGTGNVENIVAGQGLGQPSLNRVKAFRQDGTPQLDFLAYGAGSWGVNVASGSATGAAIGQLFTGPGPGAIHGPHVRGFTSTGQAMKISFFAYGTLRYGVNVTAGDVDDDGFDELATGAGPGEVFGPHVRGFAYDNTALSAIAKINFFAYGTLKYGVNVASGSVDADAFDELLTGAGPGTPFGPQVRGFTYDGNALQSISKINFNAFGSTQYGANVGSGEVDADQYDEILGALGPGPAYASQLRGYDYDGSSVAAISGFDVTLPVATYYGGRVGAGDVNGGQVDDLLAGAGRDPSAASIVRPYVFPSGGSLQPLLSFNAFPGGTYGVNVAGGALGL